LQRGRRFKDEIELQAYLLNFDLIKIIFGIICLVNYNGAFRELLDAPTGTGTCALTYTLNLLQPVSTFPTLVKTRTACVSLEGISNVGGTYNRLKLSVRRKF
jgi:hypothetical protein